MDEQLSHYRIIRRLGEGGMGEVYLAEDLLLARQVAIKLPSAKVASDPDHRQRFLREARAASVLNHPNICTIHEVGETADGRVFLAMEYVEGQDLLARLQAGPLSVAEVVEIALQTADALDAAHAKGIVHRDIKSSNICLDQRGRVKVLDFGLAKRLTPEHSALDDTASLSLVSHSGTIVGTPTNMSPEQALGKPVDPRSDLFSLGVVLYQLLTGRLPFEAASYGELVNKIANAQPEAIARFNYSVPAELDRITLKCLAKSPDRRFQSARELVIDLTNLRRMLESADETHGGVLPPASPIADVESRRVEVFPAAQLDDAAEVTPPELSRSDVLISCAKLDDQSVVPGRPGWISQFHRNLGLRLAQLSGKEVMLWKQSDPAGDSIEQILLQVPQVKTVVSVLSPPFVRSAACQRVVETFWKETERSGRFQVEQRPRILKIVKTPVDLADIPPAMRPLFSRLVPYDFFERDPQTGRLREFDEAFGEVAKQRFYERVYDVAFEISQVLRHLEPGERAVGESNGPGKTIFLAVTSSDLEPQRDQLRRELTELGHDVVPKQSLPLVASELAAVVRGCLEHCDLAIHLVGEYYGLVPEATELSVVALQNQVAAEISAERGLRRLVWMPKGQTPRDERQSLFIRNLERDPAVHRGAEVVVDTLENFKVLLRSRWQREADSAVRQANAPQPGGPARVYIICDERDEKAVEPLEDFFYARGLEVSLPGFEVSEAEVQKVHIQNLRDCDAALIYYGVAGKHWVDFNARDLQKAAGYREGRPIPVAAVYLAPPMDRRKERFKSVSVDVIAPAGDAFNPGALENFARAAATSRQGGQR